MLIDRRQMIVGVATLTTGATAEGNTPDTKEADRIVGIIEHERQVNRSNVKDRVAAR